MNGFDDPRLTAYVLGELSDAARAEVDAVLAENPAARAEVDAIRSAAAILTDAYRAESGPTLSAAQRVTVLDGPPRPRRSLLRFPDLARSRRWQVAAGLLVAVGLSGVLFGLDVSPIQNWLYNMRTSSGHDSAERESARWDQKVSIFDLLSGDVSTAGDGVANAIEGAVGGNEASAPAVALVTPEPQAPQTGGVVEASGAPVQVQPEAGRKVIKNADLVLEVQNVPATLGRIGTLAADLGGYVTSTRSNEQERWSSATIAFAVPAAQFEAALDRVRALAVKVLSESATGEDVTQQYIDLQSEIGNLEATRARIREFLDQAKTVEEALRVNSELTTIEAQIAERKGRLQYLTGRAAYSTITVALQPSASAVPTPTPTPTPTPAAWNPGRTATRAYGTLRAIVQAISTVAIWLGVVVLPLALPVVVVWWLYRRLRARRTGA